MPLGSYFTARHWLSLSKLTVIMLQAVPGAAAAHVSEQGLVLLLPTDFYIASGVLAVLLTLLLVMFLTTSLSARLFKCFCLFAVRSPDHNKAGTISSLLSLLLLVVLLSIGLTGTRDPLENLLPLFIWTIWWIGLPVLQGLVGDIWRWVNPWTGLFRIVHSAGWSSPILLPQFIGCWPAIAIFLLFTSFALADIAPDIPRRLSFFVVGYWCFTMSCLLLFGERWLQQGECFSVFMNRFSQLSVARIAKTASGSGALQVGLPGWKLIRSKATSVSASIFVLVLLGCGSFDGLNETFAWLAFIGVNPLEFPGRSAIVSETVLGLVATNILLVVVYGLCVYAGVCVANRNTTAAHQPSFTTAFCALAVSLLPIAYAYHFAHYLVTFLVNGQYAIAALSDPMSSGADHLNLGPYYVTTGFMNTPASVKTIWLTQAGAVVTGHVISVLLAHAIAVELFGNARRAIVSQVPLAVFMVVYTFIGLWLLAAPKGA